MISKNTQILHLAIKWPFLTITFSCEKKFIGYQIRRSGTNEQTYAHGGSSNYCCYVQHRLCFISLQVPLSSPTSSLVAVLPAICQLPSAEVAC